MDETSKVNALINIGQNKVVEKAYDDVLSTPSKKLGNALGTVLDIGNTCLWPFKWVNERVRIFFENNLKKYEEKLSQIESEKIATVPSEIAIPILERFGYVSNEDISNAFVNLLSSASNVDTNQLAHPGFISIIDRLCPDEAKILLHLSDKNFIPKLTLSFYTERANLGAYKTIFNDQTGLETKIEFHFPDNMNIYFNNLCSLGLIEKTSYYRTDIPIEDFNAIEEIHQGLVDAHKPKNLKSNETIEGRRKEEKGMFLVSEFGQLFIDACIKPSLDKKQSSRH